MAEPLISQQQKSANKFLWAVKTYLDLLSRNDPLVYGSGLKRLYAMSCGVATLNDDDIENIAGKAERLKLMPVNLHGFMVTAVLKNLELYGRELQRLLTSRIIDISNGDVRNPDPMFKFSAEEARRFYYVPDHNFIRRVQKALVDDTGYDDVRSGRPTIVSLNDVASEADHILTQMQGDEGHIFPTQTSWGALATCMEKLVRVLEGEARYPFPQQDYRTRSRACVKILWFMAKLLLGDLSVRPLRKDMSVIDHDLKIDMSDGTLASIPFPLKETLTVFRDADYNGVSLKGRTYLSAVAAAAFYRNAEDDRDN